MKFKISKLQVDFLSEKLKKANDFEEIELEPIFETATEAIHFENDIKAKAFNHGYKLGHENGYWKAKDEEHRIRMLDYKEETYPFRRRCI